MRLVPSRDASILIEVSAIQTDSVCLSSTRYIHLYKTLVHTALGKKLKSDIIKIVTGVTLSKTGRYYSARTAVSLFFTQRIFYLGLTVERFTLAFKCIIHLIVLADTVLLGLSVVYRSAFVF